MGGIPVFGHYGPAIGIGVVVVGITYLSLVLGELVPKRLAHNNPEKISSLMAAPIRSLARLTAPAIFLLSLSTNAILMMLRVRPKNNVMDVQVILIER